MLYIFWSVACIQSVKTLSQQLSLAFPIGFVSMVPLCINTSRLTHAGSDTVNTVRQVSLYGAGSVD